MHRRDTENTEAAQRSKSWESTIPAEVYPTFRNFREFGRPGFQIKVGRTAWVRGNFLAICSLHLVLKSDRDSTTNRPSIVADKGEDLSVVTTRLRVEYVSRVENSFGPNRQPKTRQLLRDLNTQRRIVNT